MIGLDTNVLLRFLAQDEVEQAAIATKVFSDLSADKPGFISAVVLAEMTWVMRTSYRSSRHEIGESIEALLRSTELVIENAEAAYRALGLFRDSNSLEYADALISATASLAGASETYTFDKKAARDGNMRLLKA